MTEETEVVDEKKNAADYARSALDIVYFICTFCFIQDRKTMRPLRFKLWEGQKASLPKIITEKLLIILKARQLGLTWLVCAYVVWRAIFHFNELIIIVSGSDEDYGVEFLARCKFIFDNLPDWMKPQVYKRNEKELCFGNEVKDPKTGITKIEGLNSTIKALAPTPSAGQSKTCSLLILDEAALNRYVKNIFQAAEPTLEHADGQLIVISNANKDKPGWPWVRDIYTNSMAGLNAFCRIFLDWRCVPGRGPDFLDQKRAAGMDEEDISIMYPSTEAEAISAMHGTYFRKCLERHNVFQAGTKGFLNIMDSGGNEPSDIEVRDFEESPEGIYTIWDFPYHMQEDWDGREWADRYAIGADVSEGLGHTSSTAYVMDRSTEKLVAKVKTNKVDAHDFAGILYGLAIFYNSNGELAMNCPERTGAGQTTVKRLVKLGAPQYVKEIPDTAGKPYTKQYGWSESQQAKHELMGDFKSYLRYTEEKVPCAELINQCATYVRHESGKLGHEDGHEDDLVYGAALAYQSSIFVGTKARIVGEEKRLKKAREEKAKEMGGMHMAAMRDLDAARSGLPKVKVASDDDDFEDEFEDDDDDEY